MELLSPSKSNDSQDSACDVDYDGDDGFIDDIVDQEDGKVSSNWLGFLCFL